MKLFDAFRLDTVNQCLWRGEERLALAPKAFDVLRYLVEHADRLVTHDEILEALWPETYVNPEVVKKYVLGIRKALGDHSDKPSFVATFPRRGYQFIAAVREESSSAPAGFAPAANRAFVGRESALAQLEDAHKKTLQGQRQIVFVTGEAGIGKTTLVDVFHQRAAFGANARIARGQCVEGFGGKEAYYPILEALGRLLRGPDAAPIIQAFHKLAPTWLIQFPSLVKAEQKEALEKEIFGATRERMVREICEVLESIAAQDPLILSLEDLHWVDPSTLDCISALARRRGPAKLLILATYRPAEVIISQSPLKALKQDLLVHNQCRELSLERLEESDIVEYLAAEFPEGDFPAGFADLIYRHSGGNALFMVTIVQDMVKTGLIARVDAAMQLTTTLENAATAVPETLQQLIEAQFEQLSTAEQSTLRIASVAGERFSAWGITTSSEIEPSFTEEICEALAERQQFIKAAGMRDLGNGDASAHYEFRHSLYREVLYRRLSEASRSKLHRLLGERLKELCVPCEEDLATELALHLEEGRDYEQAVRYLIVASENAARRFAYRDAIGILDHAVEVAGKLPPGLRGELEIRIFEAVGDAHFALGSMAASAQAYLAAAARAEETGRGAAQVRALTCAMCPLGFINPQEGITALDEALKSKAIAGDALLLARTQLLAAAFRLLFDAWHPELASVCSSAYEKLRGLGDLDALMSFQRMNYAYVLGLQGAYREAAAIFELGIPRTDHGISLIAHFIGLSGKTFVLLRTGQLGEVLRIVRTGRALAEKNGNAPLAFDFREAWLRILMLDFAGAQRICDSLCEWSADHLGGQAQMMGQIAAGYEQLDRRDFGQAAEHFRRVLGAAASTRFFMHWNWQMMAQLGSCETWLQSGNIVNAREEAGVFLAAALSTADPHLKALAWEINARVAMAENDLKAAKEHIQQALAIVEEFQILAAAWQAHATAWQCYKLAQDEKTAEMNRKRAESCILQIANSFAPDEPLRFTFLSAASVAQVLGSSVSAASL